MSDLWGLWCFFFFCLVPASTERSLWIVILFIFLVLKVNFQCLSYRLCEEKGNQVKEWRSGGPGSAEDEREDLCDPFSTSVHERWEQICQQNNQSSLLDLALKSWNRDPKTGWIMCESDRDMQELYHSSSSGTFVLLQKVLKVKRYSLPKALSTCTQMRGFIKFHLFFTSRHPLSTHRAVLTEA